MIHPSRGSPESGPSRETSLPRREPLSREHRRILAFSIAYLVVFAFIAFASGNYEFVYYLGLMAALIVFVVVYHRALQLSNVVLATLSLVGLLHVMGGTIHVDGTRLYDLDWLGGRVHYDNMVHMVAVFVVTLVLYSALTPHVDRTIRHSNVLLSAMLILMALGVGTINEIVEFGAVVFLGSAETVGDYWNNSLDLVFNLVGSVGAALLISFHHRRQE